MPPDLKPRASGTKTGTGRPRTSHLRKSRRNIRLGQPTPHRYRQHDETSRNMIVGTKTQLSGASPVGIDAIPVPRWSGLIATYDAKHARDMDSSRLRYDDGPSERCRVADRKTQQGCRVAGLAPACADTRSHITQEGHGSGSH